MRIKDAWVSDPLDGGQISPPELVLDLDVLPGITVEPEVWQRDNEAWLVARHGPFVKYERHVLPVKYDSFPLDEHLGADYFSSWKSAGRYNSFFTGIFPAVVDAHLWVGEEEDESVDYFWSITLVNARRLLRKHCNTWRLTLDDRAAQAGKISWKLQEVRPPCKHWLFEGDKVCGRKPTAGVVSQSGWDGPVDIPLCATHLREHNKNQASRRVASSS